VLAPAGASSAIAYGDSETERANDTRIVNNRMG
jgi:hypothetical protein